MSTSYFPHGLFLNTFFNSIQFPWRYFMIVTFLVAWVIAENLSRLLRGSLKNRLLIGTLIILILVGFNIQNQQILTRFRQTTAQQFEKLGGDESDSLGYGKEFLPSEMEGWTQATGLLSQPKDQITVTNMSRADNAFYLQYNAKESTRLIYPLLYYKGYVAKINGKEQPVEDAGQYDGTDMHGFVQVTVEGEGSVLVWYKGTLIQKISRLVSVTSLILCLLYAFLKQRKKEKHEASTCVS